MRSASINCGGSTRRRSQISLFVEDSQKQNLIECKNTFELARTEIQIVEYEQIILKNEPSLFKLTEFPKLSMLKKNSELSKELKTTRLWVATDLTGKLSFRRT